MSVRHTRVGKSIGGAIAISIALLALAVTLGAAPSDRVRKPDQGRWSWDAGAPGVPLDFADLPSKQSSESIGAAITLSKGIQPGSVRQVMRVGEDRPPLGSDGLALLSAAGANGEPCFTMLSDLGATRKFSCLDDVAPGPAIIRFASSSGPTLDIVDRVIFVGIARDDVARVTVLVRSGAEQDLPLNRWRAFGFHTSSPDSFPVALRAYAADGFLIEELPTSP